MEIEAKIKPETIIFARRAKAAVNMKCGSPALMEASAKGFYAVHSGIKPEDQIKPKYLENIVIDGETYAVFEVGEKKNEKASESDKRK